MQSRLYFGCNYTKYLGFPDSQISLQKILSAFACISELKTLWTVSFSGLRVITNPEKLKCMYSLCSCYYIIIWISLSIQLIHHNQRQIHLWEENTSSSSIWCHAFLQFKRGKTQKSQKWKMEKFSKAHC